MPYGLNQNSAPNLILVKTALDKLRDQAELQYARIGKAEATDPVVYTQDSADNAAKVSSVLGGGGYMEKTLDDLAPNKSSAISASAARTTIIASFRKNVPIARTFMMDQQQSTVSKAINQQTKTWLSTRDRNAAYVYANGFTTQTTVDSTTLFSNTHTSQNGDTVDNLETGVLSDDNLETVVNSLRQQIAQTGVKLGYEPDFLFVPTALHKKGTVITKSILRSGTGNNDMNYWSDLYPGMKCVYSPFLDDVSTTAYFVGSANHGVCRFEREAFFTELVDWKTQENDAYIYKLRAREEVDSIEYSGVVGSNGTV